MTCDSIRELAALALYDELDADEQRRLDGHLTECAACRAAQAELRAGLGALAPTSRRDAEAASGDDLPVGWRLALEQALAALPAPAQRAAGSSWRPSLLGFAAGLLVMLTLLRALDEPPSGPRTAAPPAASSSSQPASGGFGLAAPPTPARMPSSRALQLGAAAGR